MANFIQQLKVGTQVYDLYDSEFIVDNRANDGSALTGVSKASSLFDGMQITYWLSKSAGPDATLNLTLSNNTTTGAIPCYYNGTTRLGTQYTAGNVIRFIYRTNVTIDGTTVAAGWWADVNYDNSDTHTLVITGTPTGDIADYPITTTTLWTDYLNAVTNHDRIVLDIPSMDIQIDIFVQDMYGEYANATVRYLYYVMVGTFAVSEDENDHTVIFEYDQDVATWAKYADYAGNADEAYRASYVDWSGVENAPEVQPSVGSIILTTSWSGNGPYTQIVTIDDGTVSSKIDLQPDATVLSQLMTDGVTAMYVENNNGTFTVYTLGAAPTTALTIQYTRTEVS